jgi:glycosyltransferase involved in cell wall biosynthesis
VLEERPEAFADALVQLSEQPALCRGMSEAARKDAEARFSLERQVETVAATYHQLIEEAA